jgi:hypothetical protein
MWPAFSFSPIFPEIVVELHTPTAISIKARAADSSSDAISCGHAEDTGCPTPVTICPTFSVVGLGHQCLQLEVSGAKVYPTQRWPLNPRKIPALLIVSESGFMPEPHRWRKRVLISKFRADPLRPLCFSGIYASNRFPSANLQLGHAKNQTLKESGHLSVCMKDGI